MTKSEIVSYYLTDWKVAKKGETLTYIMLMIEEEVATIGDFELAYRICEEIRYLIVLSEIIPEGVKKALMADIMAIKKGFEELWSTYKK